jgi:hypothetical protein
MTCILKVGVAYDLLLSRSWIEDIRAIKDFNNKKFIIARINGQRIEVLLTLEELYKKYSIEEGL